MKDIVYDYIIFHKDCLDGFTGFYIFLKTKCWKSQPHVYPDIPYSNTVPPNIDGKNIIIIDVAYNANLLKQIIRKANYVLFVDHHITVRDDSLAFEGNDKYKYVYDVNESGASLVWNHFFNKSEMPLFVKYIKDNDIGAWKHDESIPFTVALSTLYSLDTSFENLRKWDSLLEDSTVNALVEKGKIYQEYRLRMFERVSNKISVIDFPNKRIIKYFTDQNLKVKMNPSMYKVAVFNGGTDISGLGKYIVEKYQCDFCLFFTYNIINTKYIVSMRSNKVDVGYIAKLFGGGGHKFSASFSFFANKFPHSINNLFAITDYYQTRPKLLHNSPK